MMKKKYLKLGKVTCFQGVKKPFVMSQRKEADICLQIQRVFLDHALREAFAERDEKQTCVVDCSTFKKLIPLSRVGFFHFLCRLFTVCINSAAVLLSLSVSLSCYIRHAHTHTHMLLCSSSPVSWYVAVFFPPMFTESSLFSLDIDWFPVLTLASLITRFPPWINSWVWTCVCPWLRCPSPTIFWHIFDSQPHTKKYSEQSWVWKTAPFWDLIMLI